METGADIGEQGERRGHSVLRDRKIRRQEENIGVTGREEDILRSEETGRQEEIHSHGIQ